MAASGGANWLRGSQPRPTVEQPWYTPAGYEGSQVAIGHPGVAAEPHTVGQVLAAEFFEINEGLQGRAQGGAISSVDLELVPSMQGGKHQQGATIAPKVLQAMNRPQPAEPWVPSQSTHPCVHSGIHAGLHLGCARHLAAARFPFQRQCDGLTQPPQAKSCLPQHPQDSAFGRVWQAGGPACLMGARWRRVLAR